MKLKITAAAVAVAVTSSAFAQVTVFSNNVGGDGFTDPGTTNPGASQLITSYTGPNTEVWAYTEVKDMATVGIDGTNPYGAGMNGSAHIRTLGGGNTQGKASIAYGRLDSQALGTLDNLSAWSADFYTNSSDFAGQSMVLRMYVSNGNYSGYLVYDTTWQPGNNPTITFNSWNTIDFLNNPGVFYVRGTGNLNDANALGTSSEMSFTVARNLLTGKGFNVYSFNAGFGTSSGQYDGFVDNYTIGFGGSNTVFDFEVVPEPATMAVLALPAIAAFRRKKK